jgi:hypothetical protein
MVSPSEIASIASAVSGLTATISLIYVGIQTRLSVRHTRALIRQGTAARTTSILFGFMDAEAVAIWIEGNGGAPSPELVRERQFHYQCGIAMIAMEDYFSQHELGLLSDEQYSRGSETFRNRLRHRFETELRLKLRMEWSFSPPQAIRGIGLLRRQTYPPRSKRITTRKSLAFTPNQKGNRHADPITAECTGESQHAFED